MGAMDLEHLSGVVGERSSHQDILMRVSDNKLKEYVRSLSLFRKRTAEVRYLNDVSILDTLLETEKKALAKAAS